MRRSRQRRGRRQGRGRAPRLLPAAADARRDGRAQRDNLARHGRQPVRDRQPGRGRREGDALGGRHCAWLARRRAAAWAARAAAAAASSTRPLCTRASARRASSTAPTSALSSASSPTGRAASHLPRSRSGRAPARHGTRVHPADLDGALQATVLLAPEAKEGELRLPFSVGEAALAAASGTICAVVERQGDKAGVAMVSPRGADAAMAKLDGFETKVLKAARPRPPRRGSSTPTSRSGRRTRAERRPRGRRRPHSPSAATARAPPSSAARSTAPARPRRSAALSFRSRWPTAPRARARSPSWRAPSTLAVSSSRVGRCRCSLRRSARSP